MKKKKKCRDGLPEADGSSDKGKGRPESLQNGKLHGIDNEGKVQRRSHFDRTSPQSQSQPYPSAPGFAPPTRSNTGPIFSRSLQLLKYVLNRGHSEGRPLFFNAHTKMKH